VVLSATLGAWGSEAASVAPHHAASLRCPFAKVWLEHGAAKASEMLGLDEKMQGHWRGQDRRLQEEDIVWGKCTYVNPFAGGETCMEFRGDAWTDDSAAAKCAAPMPGVQGILEKAGRCATSDDTAGWCSTEEGTIMTHTALTSSAPTCREAASGCAMWSQGTFVFSGQCSSPSGGGDGEGSPPGGDLGGDGGRCTIAPGPMGAAHQLSSSPGYAFNCSGTPAEKSPYMWPLRWTATVEQTGLGFGSDEVTYESKGRVWYMLDKNYKRLDTFYQAGIQRAVGQGPCEEGRKIEDGTVMSCNRTGPVNSTVLHRNSKMVFIDWGPDDTIVSCTQTDLGPIGNIRPDWFMDNRGASTSVQYLGDSHVYHLGEPRLVKQWRKKDFANQYFTMSVQRLPGEDGVHWPLILNVPGEGFGDDFLQHWHSHRLLEESEARAFLIDEEFVANGGECPMVGGEGGMEGPPTGQADHVPSNLEVEEASWRVIEYTKSPVWAPPQLTNDEAPAAQGVQKVVDGVHAESCFDSKSNHVRLTMKFTLSEPVWAAVSFLESEECLMTPRGGGAGEVVYAQPQSSGGGFDVSLGSLLPSLKAFSPANNQAFLDGLTPLAEVDGFGGSVAEFSNGELIMGFARAYAAKPSILQLSFAYGSEAQIGYHPNRGCFLVNELPECPVLACAAASDPSPSPAPLDVDADISSSTRSTGGAFLALCLAMVVLRQGM